MEVVDDKYWYYKISKVSADQSNNNNVFTGRGSSMSGLNLPKVTSNVKVLSEYLFIVSCIDIAHSAYCIWGDSSIQIKRFIVPRARRRFPVAIFY